MQKTKKSKVLLTELAYRIAYGEPVPTDIDPEILEAAKRIALTICCDGCS